MYLGVICFIISLCIVAFSLNVYEPSRGDSDHDGAPDYIEFELGLVELPSHWDEISNHITWDCTEESQVPTEAWRYYLLDKTSVDEWQNNYWANAT